MANRIIPIESAPDYSEGRLDYYVNNPAVMQWTAGNPPPYPGSPGSAPFGWYPVPFGGNPNITWTDLAGQIHNPNVLCVTESVLDPNPPAGQPREAHSPTSWFWNIRLGDKIRIADSTVYFTVVGPMTIGSAAGNSELFVNDGSPGSVSGLTRTYSDGSVHPIEYLFLTNGIDDDGNGFVDDGWDGIDNNRVFGVDDLDEWEHETWLPPPAAFRVNQSYTIRRRSVPSLNTKEVALPSSVVVDLTTWSTTSERSRVPVNAYTGFVDVLVNPDGTVVPTTIYSSPSSVGLTQSFLHFWLADRGDVAAPFVNPPSWFSLPMPSSTAKYPTGLQPLKSSVFIVSMSKTGKVTTSEPSERDFDAPGNPILVPGPGGITYQYFIRADGPFRPAEQGY